MKNETRDLLLGWLSDPQEVSSSAVEKLRKEAAYAGEDSLARTLIRIEKNIQTGESDVLRPLRDFFRKGATQKINLDLKMADNEIFPELRKEICVHAAAETDAQLSFVSPRRVRIELVDENDRFVFLSLYNWAVENENES